MDNDKRKKVYDVLTSQTGYKDSFEDFNRFMNDRSAREKVYGILRDKTGYKDSFDDFDNFMSGTSQGVETTPVVSQQRPSLREQVDKSQFPVMEDLPWMKNTGGQNGMLSADNLGDRLEEAYKRGDFEPFRHREEDARIRNEYTPKQVVNEADIMENAKNRFALTERGQELGNEFASIRKQKTDRYLEEFKNSDEYKAIVSRKPETQEEADAVNNAINELFSQKYGARLEEEMKPYNDAYHNEVLSRYGTDIKAGLTKLGKKSTSEQVAGLTEEVNALLEKEHGVLKRQGGSGNNAMNALMGSAQYNQATGERRKEIGALESARKLLENSQEIINEARKAGNTNFAAGLIRGVRDNFDADKWTFGLAEMADAKYLNNALEKSARGETLTPAEEKLLDASTINMATQAYFSSDLGRGYKAGSVTAESLPFMLEFLVNPISGSGNTIAKGLLKYGLKRFGSVASTKGARIAGRMIGDSAAALGMEGTTGIGRVAAGTLDRMNQNYETSFNDDGEVEVKKTGDMGIGEALARSGASTFLENQSEMIFNAFRAGGKAARKAISDAAPGMSEKTANRIIDFYNKVRNNKTLKSVSDKAQFHGLLEEYGEEVYNNMANVAIGEMSAEDAFDVDNNIDTFLGLAPTSLAFATLGIGGLVTENIQAKNRLRKFVENLNEEGREIFSELWDEIEKGHDNIAKAFVKKTLTDESLSAEEKRDRIFSVRDMINARNTEQEIGEADNETVVAIEEVPIPAIDKVNVYRNFKRAERKVAQLLPGMSEETLNSITDVDKFAVDNNLNDAQKTAVADYVSAREPYNNYQSEANTRREAFKTNTREQASADVDKIINKDNGFVIQAKHKFLDNPVYIERGNLVFGEDGLLDKEKTSKTVYYRDENGDIIPASPDKFDSILSQNTKDELVAEAEAQADADFVAQEEESLASPDIPVPERGITVAIKGENYLIEGPDEDNPGNVLAYKLDANGEIDKQEDSSQILSLTPDEYYSAKEAELWNNDEQTADVASPETEEMATDIPVSEIRETGTGEVTDTAKGVNTSENQPRNESSPEAEESKVSEDVVEPVNAIPSDEKGNLLYHKVPVNVTIETLDKEELEPEEVDAFVRANKDASAKLLSGLQSKAPKMGTNIAKYKADKLVWQEKIADAQSQVDYWDAVSEGIAASRVQPGDKTAEEILAMAEPLDGHELAAQEIAKGKISLLYDDFKRETGFSDAEARKLFGMFNSREKGGLTIEEAGELLMQNDLEEGTNFFDQEDANAGRNAILEVLSSVRTRGDLINYIKNKRDALAERERRAEEEYVQQQKEAWVQENFHFTADEYDAYMERLSTETPYEGIDANEIDAIFVETERDYQEHLKTLEDEQGRTTDANEGINGLLSEEQAGDTGGNTEVQARGDAEGTGSEDAGNDATPQEGTSAGEIADTRVDYTVGKQEEAFIAPSINPDENVLDYASRISREKKMHDVRQSVNTSPTEAQKEAGNYKKGHIRLEGYDITIENPKGSERSGTDANGQVWSVTMNNDYGYIRGTKAVDGDHIDIFLSNTPMEGNVFVVDQNKEDGTFDESKVMYGFASAEEACTAYLSNYSSGWESRIGAITEVSKDEFKKWISSSVRKTKPFADYRSVKSEDVQSESHGKFTENSISSPEISGETVVNLPKREITTENRKRSDNRLVTDERYEELKQRMKRKLGGQMNMGVDPEILAIGTEMAVYHLEKGARRFSEYATAMIADLGDVIRPYLKAFYNGARNLPEVENSEIAADMTPYDEVRAIDVANFDKSGIDTLATAETVTREAEVEQEVEIAQERIKKSRSPRKKSEKKAVNLQQSNKLDLFDGLIDNETNNENGLQRTDAERSERVSANGNRHEQGLSGGTETDSESEQQDSRGTDNGGERTSDAVDRTVRPRLSDTLTDQSLEGKRKKEVERNRKLADELKGVTLYLHDKLGGEREISGIVYYELSNVFLCNDNVSGPFQATRKELDAILKVARKSDGKATFEPKNTHNNHSERGKDHAPTSVDARIEANIKAIELSKQLLESGEKATEKQMQTLRKFSGWGGLGKAFSDGAYYAPNNIAKKLRELLGEKAYQEAVMSANSAYYTPAYVVDTLWDIAEKMGFEGGNILEGSAGIGNILGQMPTHISERSNIHAIEIDGTSGSILSLLYPDANVEIQGFEQTHIANGSVDLAITNVPFVTGLRVNDTTGDKDLSKKFHNIHDFCIAKNVRKLREGGLGIFITSNGTLDSSKKLRDWIVSEGGADFVGAFRMHNKTFGGTGVTSDIIVIRKRVNGQKSANAIDVSTVTGERMAEYDTGETRKKNGKETPVIKQLSMDYNRYFIEHPVNMAGEMHFAFEKGDTFRPTSKGLYPKQDKKQEQMLAEFVQSFSAEEFGERSTNAVTDVMSGKKIGEMFVKDGKLYINSTASAQLLEVNANKVKGHTKIECFEAYTAIKETLAEVLAYQTENESDEGLKPLLDKLNKAYDDFVDTYGHFNKNTAIAFLRNDVDYASVFALEKYEETGYAQGKKIQQFGKTDVFSRRVVEKEKEPTPTNVKDGIIASIFKFGRVNVPYIAEQLGTGIEDVKKEIIESGYGFENPATRQIEASYQYLSGNVREKLRQAEENNENRAFDRNIKALQEVMPMEIPAHLIDFTLGSSWIDPKLYEEFVKERTEVAVQFTAVGGTWFMKEPYSTSYEKNRAMGVTSEMLGRTIMGHTLIEAAINNRSITVSTIKKNWDGSTETITDKEATQACAAKIDEIRQDFKDWARQKMQNDPEMSALIERIYNDTFNNFVPMSIPDEFVPEYFGGASHKFKMRPHQGRAIVRGTQQPLLLAHEVGTGKTFTLISTAMEMRRLGTARKPMIVVQNATVGQFVASAKDLYPKAKILTLEEADRSAEGRKNFYAKIRYNDWDMIVVPQSTFEFIPDSEEREMAFVQDKIEEKMLILEKMKEEDPDGKSIITRQAEREIELLEEQLAGISDKASKKRTVNDEKKRAVALQNAEVKAMEMLDRRTDDVENFDDMGIDALLVDEAHEYKHLGFATAMQRGVKGVDPSYSKKSQGVFLKTQAVLEKNNGRNVIFATGTPISNTAAEIWTFMRYLMPADTMKEYGIYYFDDFVRNFGNIQQMLEFTTSGKFKENNRFAGYVNLPELVRIWSGVSDTVLTKEAGGVSDKIPEMEGGKAQDIYLPQTRALRGIMKFVKGELEKYDKMSGKEKKENSHIPLTMYGIAKAAAVDARLVQADAEDDEHSKTNEAVRQTLRALQETADYKGTVAIFADIYQNKHSGFNIYDDIRDKLIAEGVPADEIVVMRSGMTVKKKLEIFEKVNRGEVRVILGSTFTLGTGVNIQERLHTLIHLDAPNRPMDYTQRNGRILRQGNLHKAMGKPVRILRFGVEDSLDVTAYQRLKTKGAIADSIMNGKQMMSNSMTNRVLEEEEDVFGDTVAQLSGSEYAMLKNNAEKNMRKYASRKKQWEADQTYIHNAKPRIKGLIKDAEVRINDNSRYLDAVQRSFPDEKFKNIIIGKRNFTSIDNMDDFFKEHNKSVLAEMKQMKDGEIAGDQKRELDIQIGNFVFKVSTTLKRETVRDGATLFNDVERKMTYSCLELGIENVPVRQNLLRNAIDDITNNVITGKDFSERLEVAERIKKHNEAELEQLLSREGKPFEFEEELKQAKAQFDEYAELMKKELQEKEAKYAEMDATIEVANDLANAEEDDDTLYRSDDTMYRIREEAAPINTGIGYKVFVLKNGELYPPMVANPNGEATPIGIWLDADAAPIAGQSKTGRNQVKAGGKGTQGGSGKLAYRPGWRLGEIPYALQFNRLNPETGERELFPNNFVWAEVEYANDVDYQEEAMSYGYNKNGKFQHSLAGLPRLPENGSYKYRTNPNPETDDWIITGAMRVKRLLTPTEVDEMVKAAGREPQRRQEGAVTDEEINTLNEEFARNYREGNSPYTDYDISFENDPISKVLGKSRRTKNQRREFAQRERQRMVERVNSLAKRLHLDNVKIVTDASTLEGRKQRAKGFYSKSTGKITIVIPNHTSTFDVEQTLLHEAVAHYGLRQLFGEHFDTFLDNVFNNADETIRKRIVDMAAKNGWDFRKATEEYLASLAEKTEFENVNASWWRQIKDFFLNMLHKIGFEDFRGVTLTDNELRYILWRSYENLAEPGRYRSILGEATDIAMQYELKVGNYAMPNHINVAIASDDTLFRDATEDTNSDSSIERYEEELNTRAFKAKEAYQDSMLALKKLQDVIVKKSGKELKSFEDAYTAENHLSSKNTAEVESYGEHFFRPIIDAIGELMNNGITYEDIKRYVFAKHGLERNEVFAQRDAHNATIEKFWKEKEQLERQYSKGKLMEDEYEEMKQSLQQKEYDFYEQQYQENRLRDYSGLTTLTGEKDEYEKISQEIVEEFEKHNDTSDLWKAINNATKETLKKTYECGLINKGTYEKVKSQFKCYIPLRGWNEKTAEDVYEYLQSEISPVNATLKTAKGRMSLADDPFATIGNMAESNIFMSNRNLMKQRFMNMVLNHPSDAVSLSEAWYVRDASTGDWVLSSPDIQEKDTPEEIRRKIEEHEDRMQELAKDGDATKIKEGLNINYRISDRQAREHMIVVKRNGKEYVMYVNGNPRAAQAINGLTNPNVNEHPVWKWIGNVNRQLAANFTTRNPAFVATNLSRDLIYSVSSTYAKEGTVYGNKFIGNIPKAMRVVARNLWGKGGNSPEDIYFKEYLANGGETGYANLKDVEAYKKFVKKEIGKITGKKDYFKYLKACASFFSLMNRWAENVSRFNAYMTSREMGKNVFDSVSDAKEVTVNFNKKGAGYKTKGVFGLTSGTFRELFLFFNAAVQSLNNFSKIAVDHKSGFIKMVGGFTTAGFIIPALNTLATSIFGGDDDDYYNNLPEWVRRNNICVYVGSGKFITIPLPIELRAFYGLGEMAYQETIGRGHGGKRIVYDAINQITELLPINPLGNNGDMVSSFTPDIAKPFAQLIRNKDYTGKPIYKENPFNQYMPEWTKTYSGTSKWLKSLSEWANDITGGNKYKRGWMNVNPAMVEHLFESYFGGMAKTINQASNTLIAGIESVINSEKSEDLIWRNAPVLNRFVSDGSDDRTAFSKVNSRYYELYDIYIDVKHQLNGYKKEISSGNFSYLEELSELQNSKEYDIYKVFEQYRKSMDELKKLEKSFHNSNKDGRREIEKDIVNIKKKIIENIDGK